MNSIDKLNAAKRVQKTLRNNPNDINALLELATMLGMLKEPDLDMKRKVLNRALSLEPANKTAREMLLEMDRTEMGREASPASSQNDLLEKPLVLRYSIVHQILVYLLIAFVIYVGVNIVESIEVLLVFGAFLLFLIIPVWFVSAVVEVSSAGIKVSRLFGIARQEIAWSDIEKIKPNALGQGIKMISNEEKLLEVSSQVHGYPAIVEVLLQIRPDLFNITATSDDVSGHTSQENSVAALTGTKTFRRNFLIKYGAFLLLIPGCLLSAGTLFTQPFAGIFAVVFVSIYWIVTLTAAHTVKVQGNRLSTKSFLKQQEWTAEQIKDISMISLRNRRGVAKTYVRIEPIKGRAFKLSGFPEGNEIMYGFLMTWWNAHQTS